MAFITALVVLVSIAPTQIGNESADWLLFRPQLVVEGQVWRLFTGFLFEREMLSLLIVCGLFYVVGLDLAQRWGVWRFLALYFLLAMLTGAVTTLLVALVRPDALAFDCSGVVPICGAMTIAWASYFPHKRLQYIFLPIPIGGKWLIFIVLCMTGIYSFYEGLVSALPQMISEGLMLVHVWIARPLNLWGTVLKWIPASAKPLPGNHLRIVPREQSRSQLRVVRSRDTHSE